MLTSQLSLFSGPTSQPKTAEQLAYEAWPFPGLSWERYSELKQQREREAALARRTAQRRQEG